MIRTEDICLHEFIYEAWEGAVDTIKFLVDQCLISEAEYLIKEIFESMGKDIVSYIELNDILWFGRDELFDSLGVDGDSFEAWL